MSNNSNLSRARKAKMDEYYTRYQDVEDELKHYSTFLKDKVIYCPCDINKSSFVKYLQNNKKEIGFKKLVYTSLSTDGDFRLQDNSFADVIITNPPFSLFRDFIDWVGNKDCIILGQNNAITYRNVFPKIKSGKLKIGYNTKFYTDVWFDSPTGEKRISNICWFTTFDVNKNKPFTSTTLDHYEKYDNYDAIEVPKVKYIPKDYKDPLGVPITFIDKWNPNEYELIGLNGKDYKALKLNNKNVYARLIIRKK